MKSIYNFGIYCYKQLVALAGIRNVKARKLTQGQKGIFDYLSRQTDDPFDIGNAFRIVRRLKNDDVPLSKP